MGGPVDKGKNLLIVIAPFESKQGSRPFSDFYIIVFNLHPCCSTQNNNTHALSSCAKRQFLI